MARCIDLFVDADLGLEELAVKLGELTGMTFVGDVDGVSWLLRQGDAVARLARHGFEDDRHLPFSRYPFDLSCRLDSRNALDSAEAKLLRQVLGAVKADGTFPAMLVFDLQYVIDQAAGRAVRPSAQ
jgi:hypothetical protein